MRIIVKIKSVYGMPQAYPACPQSKLFCELTGTKTLTKSALQTIQRLGFTVEQETEKLFLGHAWQLTIYLIQTPSMQHIT